MNERILELAKQAGHRYVPSSNSGPLRIEYLTPEVEKFAELIVQKFDDILVLEYLDCVGSQDNQSKQRIEQLREKAKTYFGVEE